MSYRKRVEKKLHRKEKQYEINQLMKEKRSEEYEVLEEVFDRSTLMTIYSFMNKGVIDEIFGVVNSGKESRVYWGKDKEGKEIAIKIYLTISSEFKKGMLKYIEGDPRFKSVKRKTRSLIFTWAQKEFRNLEQAISAKIKVPKPIAVKKNVLIMEFIGKNGITAPLLKEQKPKKPEKIFKKILTNLKKLYRNAKLVHGDLSEYNIMLWKGAPIIFDMSQSVSIKHPLAESLLRRDLFNISKYFSQFEINLLSIDEYYKKITGSV
jgi:RIO kinase 1